MNEVLLIGKIEEIEFEFMYESKKISICNAKMKVNNMLVFAYGYDEVADMMYQNIKENDIELIYGRLDSEGKIEVFEFEEYKML